MLHQGWYILSLHLLLQLLRIKQVQILMMGYNGRKPTILYLLYPHHLRLLHNDHHHHQVTILSTMGWYHLAPSAPPRISLVTPLMNLFPNCNSSSPFVHLNLPHHSHINLLRYHRLNRISPRPTVTQSNLAMRVYLNF